MSTLQNDKLPFSPARRQLSPAQAALWLTIAVAGILAVCAVPYSSFFRDWRFGKMPLEALALQQERYANDPIYLYYLGRQLNEQQRFEDAVATLERGVGLNTKDVRLRDEWARAQMGAGKVSDAFGQLKQFAGENPASADALRLLGKIYISSAANGPARKALEKAVVLNPNDGEAWSLLAHARIKMADNAGGQTALENALRLRPGTARTADATDAANDHLQLAVLLTPRDPARAGQEFARAVALAPKDAVCRREYSRFLLTRGDAVAAEREARQALAGDDKDALTKIMLGRALMAQNKMVEAIPLLEDAARLALFDPQAAELLRRAYRQTGQKAEAAAWNSKYVALCRIQEKRRQLKNATDAHPTSAAAHAEYAAVLAEIGDVNAAAQQYAAALRTTPDNPRALIATARDLNRFGFADRALPLARQALTKTAMSPDAIETLADIQVNLGQLHEAAINYERIRDWKASRRADYAKNLTDGAAKLAARNAPAEQLFHQAEASDDVEQSKALLRQALALEPNNTRYLRSLLKREFGTQERDAAMTTAGRLATLSPEDGVAHSLIALLLLTEKRAAPLSDGLATNIAAHLKAAEGDLSVTPTVIYAQGLLALQRGNAAEAMQRFEEAIAQDPDALATYRYLAEAREKTGDSAGAKKAMAEFNRRAAAPEGN